MLRVICHLRRCGMCQCGLSGLVWVQECACGPVGSWESWGKESGVCGEHRRAPSPVTGLGAQAGWRGTGRAGEAQAGLGAPSDMPSAFGAACEGL